MYQDDDMRVSPIVLDLETCGLQNAADYLEPVMADKRLVDPEKIRADIDRKTAERWEKLALDYNTGRIVALGWWTEETGIQTVVCQDETQEASALADLWRETRHRTIVGFNLKSFDLRYMVQRSRYLGVAHPVLNFSKHDRKGVTDLFLELTFGDGTYDQGCMRRSLKSFCRRFGIPVPDEIDGKQIPDLVAAGEWDQVRAHCRADVALTVALAQKLGVVRVQEPALF
jgi:hypothetical protein